MTIDTSWLQSFKGEVPRAFTARMPFRPNATFTDGQIRLMKGAGWGSGPCTWDDYVFHAFVRPLENFFEKADVVILAFDNYDRVPQAKCMTQQKRRRNVPDFPFSPQCPLPPTVPGDKSWISAISNRVFKLKVIEFVILTLPQRILRDKPSRKLIIDYAEPTLHTWDGDSVVANPIDGFPPLGEADVKFPRYADLYKRIMIDSIDGDTIPIALLQYERRLLMGQDPPEVCVYRMALRTDDDDKKRKRDAKTAYEYVDVDSLYHGLHDAIQQCTGRTTLPMHQGHEIHMLVGLMCLTGTDFSRPLPLVSGKTIFENLARLWMPLAASFDASSDQMLTRETQDRLVAIIYREKFPKHVGGKGDIAQVLGELMRSKLGPKTKESIPSAERIDTTVRNVNWVLRYWMDPHAVPNPIQEEFGYRLERGIPRYIDT